ncbi:MAG: PD-(D/E)XK nuclease family transposase [Agathobacter sp.]
MSKTRNEVKKLRPIDDIFFEKIIEDKGVCEEILRVILEDDKLEVLSVTPQSSVKNLYGRSVRLDAFCKLGTGAFCNIEVQKSDNDDHVKRVRYNASCITANNTEAGERFINVPDVTMVYISTFDMFKKGKTIYHCKTVIEETGDAVDNGLKEIYVNTAVNDGSTIAELMECFLQEQVTNNKFPLLSSRVWYFKNDEGGINAMCKIVEDYVAEQNKDVLKIMFENGGSLELAIKMFQNISEEVIRKIYEEVAGNKTLA